MVRDPWMKQTDAAIPLAFWQFQIGYLDPILPSTLCFQHRLARIDLGLSELSDVENKVYLAISDLSNQFETAKTQAVLQHQFASSMGREPYFAH